MPDKPTTIERAFEIARSGKVSSMLMLERHLKGEGYTSVEMVLSGMSIRKQLRQLMVEAKRSVPEG